MQTGYRYLEEMMARDEPNMPYFGVQVEQEHTAAVFEHALSFINAMWMYSDAMRPFYQEDLPVYSSSIVKAVERSTYDGVQMDKLRILAAAKDEALWIANCAAAESAVLVKAFWLCLPDVLTYETCNGGPIRDHVIGVTRFHPDLPMQRLVKQCQAINTLVSSGEHRVQYILHNCDDLFNEMRRTLYVRHHVMRSLTVSQQHMHVSRETMSFRAAKTMFEALACCFEVLNRTAGIMVCLRDQHRALNKENTGHAVHRFTSMRVRA